MSPALEALLCRAYELDQLRGSRGVAVEGLKAAISADPAVASEVVGERIRLAGVVAARRHRDGRHGDHVSAVFLDLLTVAMGEGS